LFNFYSLENFSKTKKAMMTKTALITGASKGIGKEIALALAMQGVSVALMARNRQELEELCAHINQMGGNAVPLFGSVSSEHDVAMAIKTMINELGHIDLLINNAGVGFFKPVEELSLEEWDSMMAINVRGTFMMSKAVIPLMKLKNNGLIINIISDIAHRTFPNGAGYCASKYAQHAFADAMRKEVLEHGIRVSNIYPGMTDTYFAGAEQGADYKKGWLQAQDIAQAVLYVMSAPQYVVIDEITLHPTMQKWW
jgi:NADP-dependent 3-hydroxy acid dehydrogenase YdfG